MCNYFKITSYSCGIIINYAELIRSEGFEFVAGFLEKTIERLNNEIKYICFDNACHLYGVNEKLNDKTFVIDRFHLKNHKQMKCKTKHNCDSYVGLEDLNTEICEQKFSRMSRLKHQVKHMNKHRFNFFLLQFISLLNLKESMKWKKNK